MSKHQEEKLVKYRDAEGNTYAVEKSIRSGRYIVVRINPGGQRKAVRRFVNSGNASFMQWLLNLAARRQGWKEVGE